MFHAGQQILPMLLFSEFKIENKNFVKNENVCEKSKILWKIEHFVKNQIEFLCKKIWSKIQIMA